MRKTRHLDISNHRVWKDKNIKPEAKEVYAYLYAEGFDRTTTYTNIGRVQK